MLKFKLYTKHLFISFVIFLVLLCGFVLIRGVINSQDYRSFVPDLNVDSTSILFAIVSLLASLVVYLVLMYRTRLDLEVKSDTESLNLSKEQLGKLYESAPVPYLLLNDKAEIHSPNKAALRFFGVFPEEINGKNLFSYLSGGDNELAEKLLQYYKAGIPINRKEVDFVTKKGDVRSVQLSVFEMRNPGSFSSTGLVMIFDVTEQKLLDKAKTEFVSLASHQLKTPLATTKWFSEMLLSGDLGNLSAKQKEYVDKLHTTNEDMVDLVDILLNVSRIEMGSLAVDLKPTNVTELSESILEELSFLIHKKNIKIVRQYNDLLQNIKSDPKLLRIAIQNLVSNAVKYTPDGGTVTITFEESAGEKQIIVSDTGLGIPKDQQGRIFSKLFRADNVRSLGNSQGTGLGLYLIKSIIASIGGSISFVSEENKGSAFTIKL